MVKRLKQKSCKQCLQKFQPRSSLQVVCSIGCATKDAKEKDRKARSKKVAKEKREYLNNDKAYCKARAQKQFNKFIRLRDAVLPCISCGTKSAQFHAGHYRPVGAWPMLRFEESNCHKQCSQCNNNKSGNLSEYRINLIKKIGLKQVEWLEGPHHHEHFTAMDFNDIWDDYKKKCKVLEAQIQ